MKPIVPLLLAFVVILSGVQCANKGKTAMTIKKQAFGTTQDGTAVDLYALNNGQGITARIMTYGAIIVSLETPDRDGNVKDIVLGFDNLADYEKSNPYFGAIVGRYGNRIGKGQFTLNGQDYQLATNDGDNHLHGGVKGFDKVVWEAESVQEKDRVGLKLHYLSPNGEEGYPGALSLTVTYWLNRDNELVVDYQATTDKPTVVNPTHHSYFNLAGPGETPILDHQMQIFADNFTPTDAGLIPTGEMAPVEGTPMDFRQPTAIGARISADYQPLKFAGGYDHNWVLNRAGDGLSLAARVTEPTSGRVLEVLTTEPGLQFYAGNFLDGTLTGKNGVVYQFRTGFCLEAQHYPDSPNKLDWPSVVLNPGQTYTQETVYRFSAQ